jgi:hypothetical protein
VTQCLYKPVDKMIECKAIGENIECAAIFEWPVSGLPMIKGFGLGMIPELNGLKTDLVKYWMYPRSLDNMTYVNHIIMVDGIFRDVFLYYGEKFVEYGIRVTDSKCFGRLVNLINGSPVHMLPIESDFIIKSAVSMIGEVLIFDKDVSKRWLFGGFPLWGGFWNPLFYGAGVWGK